MNQKKKKITMDKWLKFINVVFLQWFFVRLTKNSEKVITEYKIHSLDMMADGQIGSRGVGKTENRYWYSIQGFIVPCTGWWIDFKFVSKEPMFWKITKVKVL